MEKIVGLYEKLIGLYMVEQRKGFCKVGLPYRKEVASPLGNFHGGVIASIIDTATVMALRATFNHSICYTVDLNIRYKSPSNHSEIFVEARPSHLKGKFYKTDVKVLDKENKLVAEAQVKSFLAP